MPIGRSRCHDPAAPAGGVRGSAHLRARRLRLALVTLLASVGLAAASALAQEDHPLTARTASPTYASWDVIVVGAEPEAIAAAVAAAEEGARTLLISDDPRLGGLFVRGALNVLDLRVTPSDFQLGLFERWWRRVGRYDAFDVDRAERAFADLLAQAGVDVRLSQPPPRPWVEDQRVVGVVVGAQALRAAQVIDGTGDADVAHAAGAGSSWGFEGIGYAARMVDTLVFRIDGVDWPALRRGIAARGRDYAHANERVAYGHFGGHPAAYRAQNPGLRLRGLNLGRQDDGSVLVNALLIYGVDPLDPASRDEGRARAAAEVEHVVAWLARDLPGFANARAGGVADDLYVRQTRHLDALCRLTIDDVLDHVVTGLDVAQGGYPLDVQTLRPTDDGFVFGLPEVYGGRLCMMVPRGVDGLWVVGRSAGYDPLAQSSARVVPFGMAMAEAAGVAAAWGVARDLQPRAVADDPEAVRAVRARLAARGAVLPTVQPRPAAGPVGHPHYDDYRALLRWGLAVGGYGNDPRLDAVMAPTGLLFLLANVSQRALRDETAGRRTIDRHGLPTGDLAPAHAAAIVGSFLDAAALVPGDPWPGEHAAWDDLRALGLPVADPGRPLRRGETYALAAWVLDLAGRRYPPDAGGSITTAPDPER